MLILSRKVNERVTIRVGETVIRLCVVSIDRFAGTGKIRARIGFDAPAHVEIMRDEIDPQQTTEGR